MFKINKSAFFQLYRYYLKKLLLGWIISIVLTLVLIGLTTKGKFIWVGQAGKGLKLDNWGNLWINSLIRNLIVLQVSIGLISVLVQKAKIEDSWVLTACSPVNRQSILAAKLASFYTYYFPSCLFFTNAFAFTNPLFLLLDWFLLILVNFLLFFAPLFYLSFPARSKIKKFLILALYAIFILGILYLFSTNPEIKKIFVDNPWVPMLLSIFIGPLFLWLYWENFRNYDY